MARRKKSPACRAQRNRAEANAESGREYQRLMDRIAKLRPVDAGQLHCLVSVVLGVHVPKHPMTPGSSGPFDYLKAAFFESEVSFSGVGNTAICDRPLNDKELAGVPGSAHGSFQHAVWHPSGSEAGTIAQGSSGTGGGDLVVWANRGGGKTFLGAVATLLDLIFKPGIQVRILGGSLEQSSKMYGYLLGLIHLPGVREIFPDLLGGEPTQRRIALAHGSVVEVLSQSHRSVRGQRVHKIRCDEVELFQPDVWEAAQLVTRSGWCGPVYVRGTVEALSTMHRPFGLMSRIVARAAAPPGGAEGELKPARLFRWCALDVVERCGPSRACQTCALAEDCQGLARRAEGFVPVADLVDQQQRISRQAWESEMLCRQPRRSDSVYPGFDPQVHVAGMEADGSDVANADDLWIAGMDFGLRNPLVMLWGRVIHGAQAKARGALEPAVLEIVDEYSAEGLTLEEHLRAIEKRPWPKPAWIGVDPAGLARNDQTGLSDVQVLRGAGYRVRHRRSNLREGIERIRRRLDRRTLRLHSRCRQLQEALVKYHFDPQRPERDEPVKDGPDHLADALRYMVVNLELGTGKLEVRRWA
ncbi:MAG: hypothetical protein IT443_01695 [Phycisphaeraceae bacterium]|nr:hypothetical protein [Phycisphaeraceae bacterium]